MKNNFHANVLTATLSLALVVLAFTLVVPHKPTHSLMAFGTDLRPKT